MRLFYTFLSFFHISILSAMDIDSEDNERSATQEYSSEDETDEAIPCALDDDELDADLKDLCTVRNQIVRYLHGIFPGTINRALLTEPVLCVGTGTNKNSLKCFARPTYIRDIDFSIDVKRRHEPHCVADAFDHGAIMSSFPRLTFGAVFFAHVSNPIKALGAKDWNKTLALYCDALLPGGYFIFASEVCKSKSNIMQSINEAHLAHVDQLKTKWEELLAPHGFVDVKVIIKDETGHYLDKSHSLVLVARKNIDKNKPR